MNKEFKYTIAGIVLSMIIVSIYLGIYYITTVLLGEKNLAQNLGILSTCIIFCGVLLDLGIKAIKQAKKDETKEIPSKQKMRVKTVEPETRNEVKPTQSVRKRVQKLKTIQHRKTGS